MEGFRSAMWLRGEMFYPPKRFPSEERRPWKRARQTNSRKFHVYVQRKTR